MTDDELTQRRDALSAEHTRARDAAEAVLMAAKSAGRESLTETEQSQFDHHWAVMAHLGAEIESLDEVLDAVEVAATATGTVKVGDRLELTVRQARRLGKVLAALTDVIDPGVAAR